jgi:hypothetical protein
MIPTQSSLSRRRRIWLFIAAIWLQIVVVAFLIMQVNRISTPMADWMHKIIDLVQAR